MPNPDGSMTAEEKQRAAEEAARRAAIQAHNTSGYQTGQPNPQQEAARGHEANQKIMEQAAKDKAAREAAAAVPTPENPFREQQLAAADYLAKIISGEESASKAEAKQLTEQAVGRQLGLLAAARPGQGPVAARTAAQAVGDLQSSAAGQALLASIQEREAAARALAALTGAARGQDIDLLLGQEGMTLQEKLANLQARTTLEAARISKPREPSWWEKGLGAISSGIQSYTTLKR